MSGGGGGGGGGGGEDEDSDEAPLSPRPPAQEDDGVVIKGMSTTPRVAEAKSFVDPLAGFMELQQNKHTPAFDPLADLAQPRMPNPLDAPPRRNSDLQGGLAPLDGATATRPGELVLENHHTVSGIKCALKITQEEFQVVVTAMDESKGDFYTATANLHRAYVDSVCPDPPSRAALYDRLVAKLCFKSGGQEVQGQVPRHMQKKSTKIKRKLVIVKGERGSGKGGGGGGS